MPRPRLAAADSENVGGNFEPELLKVLRRVRAEEPLLGLKEYTDRVREKLQLRPLPGVEQVREALRSLEAEQERSYWELLMAPASAKRDAD